MPTAVPEPKSSLRSSRDPQRFLDSETAHKLYSREFFGDRVSKIGDPQFCAARKTWKRLMRDFSVHPDELRRLVGVAFMGPAKRIYEEVTSLHLNAEADELWDLLESKLYNTSQQHGQRASFFAASWKERTESIDQFGARPRTMSLLLPDHVTEEALIRRFIEGLPSRLRAQALLVNGSCDEWLRRPHW